ncbi:hypothetical protein EGW08_011053 [Elysia chlorotica]|uniref:Cystatin domain-containing protein n=1 Tax=Elysia chlorotica TaxID=188477 RepID=A0A433THW9_ELYCH|nr:hypothetical protein EGW08_011053 [Elysia chlorotica]
MCNCLFKNTMKSVSVLFAFLALLVAANAKTLLGGEEAYSPNAKDEEVVFAMQSINDKYANDASRTLVKIIHATSQVVEGSIFRYTIEVTGGADGNEVCEVSVWSQPWLTDASLRYQIVDDITCRPLYSGVTQALDAIEKFLNRRWFNTYYMRIKNSPAILQVRSYGEERFKISKIEMSYTSCIKSTAFALTDISELIKDCPVEADADVEVTCSATVVKSGGPYTVESHQCEPNFA